MFIIELMLVAFIGRTFHELAEKSNQPKWPYTILGIAVYYGGSILWGVIIGVAWALFVPRELTDNDQIIATLVALPLGLLTTWLVYRYLTKRFKKLVPENLDELIGDFGEEQSSVENEDSNNAQQGN